MNKKDHHIKGVSYIKSFFNKDTPVSYFGSYQKGIFHDNCAINDLEKDKQKGWGIKFDLFFAPIVRPFMQPQRLWDKTKVYEIPYEKWEDVFGKKLTKKLKEKWTDRRVAMRNVHDYHFNIYNPWKAIKWFTMRIPPVFPLIFLSISNPWKSFYIGFKTSRVNPFLPKNYNCMTDDANDITWTNEKDKERALENEPAKHYRAGVLSMTIRSDRQ